MDDAIAQQHALVDAYKAQREKRIYQNTKDIRDEIAKGGHYDPKSDPIYEYKPYPKWVDGVIVHSKQEHDAMLGVKHEPKVATVEVADLTKPEVTPAVRRGRPPKVQPAPLPQNLD